jgi:hypothetical protein
MVSVELALHRARDATAREVILKAVTEVWVAGSPLAARRGRAEHDHPTDGGAGQEPCLPPQPQEVGEGL